MVVVSCPASGTTPNAAHWGPLFVEGGVCVGGVFGGVLGGVCVGGAFGGVCVGGAFGGVCPGVVLGGVCGDVDVLEPVDGGASRGVGVAFDVSESLSFQTGTPSLVIGAGTSAQPTKKRAITKTNPNW